MITNIQLVIFMMFCINATLAGYFLIRFRVEEKPKSNLNGYVYILLAASVVWSVGMGLMSLQVRDTYAYYFRTFGILGTFVFMAGVQFALCFLSEIPERNKRFFNAISLTGIPIFLAYSIPGQTIFVHNQIGTTFYFKQGPINIIYSAYFLFVSLNIFIVTLHTAKHSSHKRVSATAKRLLVVEMFIFTGAIFDMILPSLGYAAIPGSAITHFWGVCIFWIAIHKMYKSELTVANMSEYVYHSLNAPVLIFNADRKLEIINNAAISFFSIEEETFSKGLTAIDSLFDANEEVFDFEGDNTVRNLTSRLNDAHCEVSISKIMDSYKDIVGYICLSSDLTEHELAMSKLEQAKLAADAANMSKSLFLANMSHEIRTPMNAILGFSEIALTEDIDETSRGYFGEIKRAGDILLTVINDILNISKIELGKAEIDNHDYSFARLIKDVELITRSNANKKGLVLNVNVEKDFPENLKGDSNKIREILLNILGNSVKYTNEGTIDFNVFAANRDNNKLLVRFEVTDTGIGIAKEYLPTIFDKFSRADAKLTSSTEGTGLGLSITKGLVDLLGGTIEVKSEYGVGTTFIVEIPQEEIKPEVKEESTKKETLDQDSFDILEMKNCNFLIVDDTKINLIVAEKFLNKYGANIDKALSGKESVEMCKNKKYNIVFMDHMMPEMDGVEAMKLIREIPGYEKDSSQKIVALTANAVDSAKDLLMSEGFDDFISKPIKAEILDSVIRRVLSI